MCGIVGYVGPHEVVPLIMEGLSRLEYRGYDSSGIAVIDEHKRLSVRKKVGRLAGLEALLEKSPIRGVVGIGHTRWATHGEPSDPNAHPHTNAAGTIAVVHNGIIENFQEFRDELEAEGVVFSTQTDTEVLPNLLEREMKRGEKTFLEALLVTLRKVRGNYAFGILNSAEPDTIYAARHGSPLIVGVGRGQNFIASDVPAILNHVDQVVYLNEGEVIRLTKDKLEVFDLAGNPVIAEVNAITVKAESAERSGFDTYMLKEIHEQPRILRGLLQKHVSTRSGVKMDLGVLKSEYLNKLQKMMIIGCGTAYYAGLYGKMLLENLTSIATEIDLASEFRYRNPIFDSKTLIMAVSQSGETADTLGSVRLGQARGCKLISICNVQGSTLTRESDSVFYTEAGPEIGVASTKAFTSQLMAFALFAIYMAKLRGNINQREQADLLRELQKVPDHIHLVLQQSEAIQAIANKHHDGPSALYLGRRYNYPIALEGALKNKEISYQHAEGYAAGEMKHGPIALINEYLPVICLCTKTNDQLYEKMMSNMKEVQARHGRIIAIATEGDKMVGDMAEDVIYVPEIREEFAPMVNVVALQLLAYYAAQARGTDIDKPRNLAKSVTVE